MGLPPENIIEIDAALRDAANDGPIWSMSSEQLNLNLIRLPTGDGIAEHVNNEVDVVLVVFEGRGQITVDGAEYPLHAGQALVVPRGAKRGIRCATGPLVYLTCHRRRAGLMPS